MHNAMVCTTGMSMSAGIVASAFAVSLITPTAKDMRFLITNKKQKNKNVAANPIYEVIWIVIISYRAWPSSAHFFDKFKSKIDPISRNIKIPPIIAQIKKNNNPGIRKK